jgi:hypothetical protein
MSRVTFHFDVDGDNFTSAGQASVMMKKNLRQLGISPEIIRRVSIAMYEGEINMVIHAGGGVAEVMVMSPDVAEIMMSNDKYAKLLDNRGIDIGKINTRYKGQGVRLLGVNGDGVEMYSFSGKFEDDDGKRKPILPEGSLILGGKGMIKCLYGPVTQVEEDGPKGMPKTYIKKEVPLRYAHVKSNSVKNRLTSCPTMVPFNVDAWVLANVL